MIDKKELRIDNYLRDWHNHKIVKVESIGLHGINVDVQSPLIFYNFPYLQLVPIEITDEWLHKFGFVQTRGIKILYIPNNDNIFFRSPAQISPEEFSKVILYTGGTCVKIKEVTFVHQLQNLYHIITGEELKEINNGMFA